MKVGIFGECSGVIRRAMQKRGHETWSFDLKPAEDGETRFHILGDFTPHIDDESFDLGIFHPTCKRNANSGAKHLYIGMKKENGICPVMWEKMEGGGFVHAALS